MTGAVLERATENVLANWEALLLQIGLGVAAMLSFMAVGFAVWVPVIFSAAGNAPPDPALWALVAATVVGGGLVWSAISAFALAANASLYLNAYRAAASSPERSRAAYRAFTFAAWVAAGRALWARAFGIQMATGAAVSVVIGVPLLLVTLVGKDAAGCLILVLIIPLALAAAVIVPMWSKKAVVIAAGRNAGVVEALDDALHELLARFGEHFVPLLVVGVVAWLASLVLATIATAAGGAWALSAMVVLTEERRRW